MATTVAWLTMTVIGTAPTLAETTTTNTSDAPPSISRAPEESRCPALYVLGVQSSEEGAATSVDTGDSGMLGQALGKMMSTADGAIDRAYVVFGSGTDPTNYAAGVAEAADRIEQAAAQLIDRCASTRIAVAGYAQGASAAASFAEKVGAGRSQVPGDSVAGIALLANPTRRAAAGALPGTDNASTPSPAPGTGGANVAAITLSNTGLSGAGIAASAAPISFGALAGRVAGLCVAGDATCDVQSGSPLLTAVANITGQAEGKDPVAAIGTVAQALASTVFSTAVGVVNDDFSGTSLDQPAYAPTETLGERIARASSPTAEPVTESDALSALFKIGTIGLNAVVSVAQKVFTATTIAELAAVGLSNPAAAVAVLGTKVADAVVDLVPPQSLSTWVNDAFDAITTTITDTQDLYTAQATAQFSDTTGRSSTYSTVTATATGHAPVTATANWFTALARDIAASQPITAPTPAADATTTGTVPPSSAPSLSPTPLVPPSPRAPTPPVSTSPHP
ncbi:cutinase family protein [Nocardia sp. NPDC050378]|uniref:cutinase family protein n=1 Tax=Nocardia sp. NPDC050378 TaxID=3155400 RepID=UPI0033D1DC1C